MIMQDIRTLEKHCIWSGIVYSDLNSKTYGDFYFGSKRNKSDYLSVFQTVCCLANFVYSLFNGKMVQMVRWTCWSPLSSTDPSNIGQMREITCYVYLCEMCDLCVCKLDDLILLVSLDFKTLWKMFTQRGKYVTGVSFMSNSVVFNYTVLL